MGSYEVELDRKIKKFMSQIPKSKIKKYEKMLKTGKTKYVHFYIYLDTIPQKDLCCSCPYHVHPEGHVRPQQRFRIKYYKWSKEFYTQRWFEYGGVLYGRDDEDGLDAPSLTELIYLILKTTIEDDAVKRIRKVELSLNEHSMRYSKNYYRKDLYENPDPQYREYVEDTYGDFDEYEYE